MKLRSGFVSNSSTSSFVCDICGEENSGYDMGIEEAGMTQCINGHVFCEEHGPSISVEKKEEMILRKLEEYTGEEKKEFLSRIEDADEEYKEDTIDEVLEEIEDDWRYGTPPENCPICQYLEFQTKEALAFLMQKNNISKKDLLEDMKKTYPNYRDLQESLKGKNNEN